MNTIHLGNGYRVEIDAYNHTLIRRYKTISKKTKEEVETEKIVGYYSNLNQAVKKYLSCNKFNNEFEGTFEEYLKFVDERNENARDALISIIDNMREK